MGYVRIELPCTLWGDEMDQKPPRKSFLRRTVPIYIVIPLIVASCVCGLVVGRSPSSTGPTLTQRATRVATADSTRTPEPPREALGAATPSQTLAPTSTTAPSDTPVPPATQTAVALAAARTEVAFRATATRQALNLQRTLSAEATAARVTLVAQYVAIDYRELVNYADAHVGEKVWIRGRVFNINSNTELQMYFAGTYDAAYVVMEEPFSGIYENDVITVYGTVQGKNCGTNSFGAEICQPLISDGFYSR